MKRPNDCVACHQRPRFALWDFHHPDKGLCLPCGVKAWKKRFDHRRTLKGELASPEFIRQAEALNAYLDENDKYWPAIDANPLLGPEWAVARRKAERTAEHEKA